MKKQTVWDVEIPENNRASKFDILLAKMCIAEIKFVEYYMIIE